MSELTYDTYGAATRDRTHTLFAQTMGYVAVTTGTFALGAYLGRNLSHGWAFVWYIVAFVCLIAMNFTVKRSAGLTVVLLLAVGLGLGLALAPTLAYYASMNPQVLWQAGGATALFIAGFGAEPNRRSGQATDSCETAFSDVAARLGTFEDVEMTVSQ